MSFGAIGLLAGMAALAIPIIIHLFHKSRFKVVNWGAMHLLEAVVRQNQRRVRMEQWILLLVRCAIPVLLALAMARPIWKGAQKLLGEAKTSTIVLLDNSYSMEAGRAGTSNWELAKDEAARIIGNLQPNSEAAVVLLGEGGRGLLDAPTTDTGRLIKEVKGASAGFGAATVPAGLDLAANLFGQMHETARQVVVLTDFQRVSFEAEEDKLLRQMVDRLKNQEIPPSITLFDVGSEVRDNVAIESLEFSRLVVGVGQRIQVRANIRNYGDQKWPDLRVLFKVDGRDKSVSQLNLGAQEKGQVLFTHSFDTAGSHVIEVVADADTLKADNSFLASIPVRDKVPLLLVNGDPSSEPLKGETDFAEIALQPYSAGRVEQADLIETKVISPENLNSKVLSEVSVAVLANVRKLGEDQLRALEEFVKNGGGLLIAPGNRTDTGWWNGTAMRYGKGLLPLAYGTLAGNLNENASVGIVSERFENPALELFNDPRNGSLSEAAIKVWFKMKETSNPESADAPMILARLESGDPFLVEKRYGEGRVIAMSTAIDADWSNLPMRPFYLPLMQRLCVYLASTVYPPRNLEVHRPLMALLPASDAGKKATLTLPSGEPVDVQVVKKGDRGVVEFADTRQPGLYVLQPPDGAPIHYVVNARRRESDLTKLSETDIAELANSLGVNLVRSGAEYAQLDKTQRFGTDIWKTVLFALLGFVALEMVLEQRFAGVGRRRSQS